MLTMTPTMMMMMMMIMLIIMMMIMMMISMILLAIYSHLPRCTVFSSMQFVEQRKREMPTDNFMAYLAIYG